jgi:hypothetical protein
MNMLYLTKQIQMVNLKSILKIKHIGYLQMLLEKYLILMKNIIGYSNIHQMKKIYF